MPDATYQSKIYKEGGGDKLVIKSGGVIEGQSGGDFDAQDDFTFFSSAVTAQRMKNSLLSLNTRTVWGASGTGVSGDSIITPGYGYHMYDASTKLSKMSLYLPSAYVGMQLVMDCSNCVNDANMSVFAESGGGFVSLYDEWSVRCSSMEISAAGRVKLVANADDIWAVVERGSSVDVNPAA